VILLDGGNSRLKAQYWDAGKLQACFATRYSADWFERLHSWLSQCQAAHCYFA
jgi:pantothenate kinase type III